LLLTGQRQIIMCLKTVNLPMIKLENIHPVTDFARQTKKYIRRLKKTGNPEVLTVNGEAEIVVQSAAAYEKLLRRAELADAVAGIQRGLDDADNGKLRRADDFLRELAAEHNIELK
jgi:prevent-host-death family protein